jgi:NHL repeat
MSKLRADLLRVATLMVMTAAACGSVLAPATDGGPGSDGSGPSSLKLALVAGDVNSLGNLDGVGVAARFRGPSGVAVDGDGNVYVADQNNYTIRKITPTGTVTTLAGRAGMFGSTDASGATARFGLPSGVAVDHAGMVYVADTNNQTIRKITPTGTVTTLAGTAGALGSANGDGAIARFRFPTGIAVDLDGNLYVADRGNDTIRKITPTGTVTTLAGTAGQAGSANGTGATALFDEPTGIAVDVTGNVYVADQENDTVRKITSNGVVTTLAGTAGQPGSADGTGAAARFSSPASTTVDAGGNVYVADQSNHTIRRITSTGVVTTLAGTVAMPGTADGDGAAARFANPSGVAADSTGSLYVADQSNHTIRHVIGAGHVTTFAGGAGITGGTDGAGGAARFNQPAGMAVDGAGNVYVADTANATIRKVVLAGDVTTLAGAAGMPGSANGAVAVARFSEPGDIAVDGAGNVYVADTANATIRKITAAGVVTTLAGAAGQPGEMDGTGDAARFSSPTGVAVDTTGNLYVVDQDNHAIRKVTPAGEVTTFAGRLEEFGIADGVGTAARFSTPSGIAIDAAGNLYVADTNNHTIRKITAAGVVTTLAGTPSTVGSADGAGAAAQFSSPVAVAVDGSGNVYVADTGNATIRKVTPAGVTTTIAGTAGVVGIRLGGAPSFASPRGLAFVGDALVISDANAILVLRPHAP